MPKKTVFPEINLIPKDPFYETPLGKAMVWSLRVGRYLVIFTEIIVIMSFASRFKLDRDLTDLNTSIVQKTAVVQSYGDTEKKMRLIQKRSEAVAKLLEESSTVDVFHTLISKIPPDIKVTRLGFDAKAIAVAGVARSSSNFAQFLQIMQSEPTFHGVTIDQIAKTDKNDQGLTFSVHIALKEEEVIQAAPKPVTKEKAEDI